MSAADHVRRIALFTERNPEPGVIVFHLGPHSGRAEVATRIRLASSQSVLAVAQMNDGSCWQSAVDVVVTMPACAES
jgi:sulfur-oxidizing protein SoxY